MKRTLLLIALAACAFSARAATIGFITLDQNQPKTSGGHYTWEYTISVSNGDLNDLQSIIIDGVGGVLSVYAPQGWDASISSDGPGLSNVVFSREWNQEGSSENGFYINSIYGSGSNAAYTVTYSDDHRGDDPVVGAPAAAAPEPATLLLTGVALLGLSRLRRSA